MQSFSSSVGHVAGLVSRRTLLAEGLAEAAVQFRDRRIAACDANQTRGMIVVGLRADAIVVNDRRPGLPRVVAAMVGGRLRHTTRHLPLIG